MSAKATQSMEGRKTVADAYAEAFLAAYSHNYDVQRRLNFEAEQRQLPLLERREWCSICKGPHE